jgi:hypothetical protein
MTRTRLILYPILLVIALLILWYLPGAIAAVLDLFDSPSPTPSVLSTC